MFLVCLSNLRVILVMNSQWNSAMILATGQSVPFTGTWLNITNSRNTLIIAFASGSATTGTTINVQTSAAYYLGAYDPSFQIGSGNEGVTLYSFTGMTPGYQSPALITAPVTSVRLVATGGSGTIFSYALLQN